VVQPTINTIPFLVKAMVYSVTVTIEAVFNSIATIVDSVGDVIPGIVGGSDAAN
jgi:hypothetical protein